jgi:hypothetical protein
MVNSNDKLIGEAQQFDEKINTIKQQFFSALDDFQKYYVYFNKNPEVNEFQNYYASSKGQLQHMSRDIFLTTNEIDKIIEELNTEMSEVSIKLENEKTLNAELTGKLQNLEKTQNGSEIMLDDSKTAYNIQYYKNWEMFIGVIGVTGLILKIYKAPSMPITNK